MISKNLVFCGKSSKFLKEELTKESNLSNGGIAFRIPTIVKAKDTLVAVADRQCSGADWGYIELSCRRSKDNGKTWSDIETIVAPPARETKATADSFASSFFISPSMTVAENGDIILLATFFPECKGKESKKSFDKKKVPYAQVNGVMVPVLYDRDDNYYTARKDGFLYDSNSEKTDYEIKNGLGALYRKDEYMGNIFLNGAMGKSENDAKTTFGAPIKAPKRSYIFMIRSKDCGKTWEKPKDITAMIQNEKDGAYISVSAGNGARLPNGRIVVPLVSDDKSFSIYSNDNGETWHRMMSYPYTTISDEWTPAVSLDGTIFALGNQKKYGKTPVSVSYDNAKSWLKSSPTMLYSANCQKSAITKNDYVFCSHPSEKDRKNGIISIGKFRIKSGRVTDIDWISHIKINDGYFGYSSLCLVDENTVGVLYEAEPSSYILFDTFSITEYINK